MQRRVAEGRPRKSRTHSLTSRNSATVLLSFFFFLRLTLRYRMMNVRGGCFLRHVDFSVSFLCLTL